MGDIEGAILGDIWGAILVMGDIWRAILDMGDFRDGRFYRHPLAVPCVYPRIQLNNNLRKKYVALLLSYCTV